MMLQYRLMSLNEIPRIAEIDRSEHIQLTYKYRSGELQPVPEDIEVPTWSGDWLEDNLRHWTEAMEAGGTMLGAFDGDQFAGFAILGEPRLGEDQDQLQLVSLYISHPYRRCGIATQLLDQISTMAKSRGAAYLYISASPTESAIGFYLSQGCFVAPRVDPALYALEPEDIHLLKRL